MNIGPSRNIGGFHYPRQISGEALNRNTDSLRVPSDALSTTIPVKDSNTDIEEFGVDVVPRNERESMRQAEIRAKVSDMINPPRSREGALVLSPTKTVSQEALPMDKEKKQSQQQGQRAQQQRDFQEKAGSQRDMLSEDKGTAEIIPVISVHNLSPPSLLPNPSIPGRDRLLHTASSTSAPPALSSQQTRVSTVATGTTTTHQSSLFSGDRQRWLAATKDAVRDKAVPNDVHRGITGRGGQLNAPTAAATSASSTSIAGKPLRTNSFDQSTVKLAGASFPSPQPSHPKPLLRPRSASHTLPTSEHHLQQSEQLWQKKQNAPFPIVPQGSMAAFERAPRFYNSSDAMINNAPAHERRRGGAAKEAEYNKGDDSIPLSVEHVHSSSLPKSQPLQPVPSGSESFEYHQSQFFDIQGSHVPARTEEAVYYKDEMLPIASHPSNTGGAKIYSHTLPSSFASRETPHSSREEHVESTESRRYDVDGGEQEVVTHKLQRHTFSEEFTVWPPSGLKSQTRGKSYGVDAPSYRIGHKRGSWEPIVDELHHLPQDIYSRFPMHREHQRELSPRQIHESIVRRHLQRESTEVKEELRADNRNERNEISEERKEVIEVEEMVNERQGTTSEDLKPTSPRLTNEQQSRFGRRRHLGSEPINSMATKNTDAVGKKEVYGERGVRSSTLTEHHAQQQSVINKTESGPSSKSVHRSREYGLPIASIPLTSSLPRGVAQKEEEKSAGTVMPMDWHLLGTGDLTETQVIVMIQFMFL